MQNHQYLVTFTSSLKLQAPFDELTIHDIKELISKVHIQQNDSYQFTNPKNNQELITEIEKTTHLTFNNNKEDTNLCFATKNEVLRDDFKQVFTLNDLVNYKNAVKQSPSFTASVQQNLKNVPPPENTDVFWILVKLGKILQHINLPY